MAVFENTLAWAATVDLSGLIWTEYILIAFFTFGLGTMVIDAPRSIRYKIVLTGFFVSTAFVIRIIFVSLANGFDGGYGPALGGFFSNDLIRVIFHGLLIYALVYRFIRTSCLSSQRAARKKLLKAA